MHAGVAVPVPLSERPPGPLSELLLRERVRLVMVQPRSGDHRKRRQFAQGRRVRWAKKRQVPVSDAHLVEVFRVRFGIAVVPLV